MDGGGVLVAVFDHVGGGCSLWSGAHLLLCVSVLVEGGGVAM